MFGKDKVKAHNRVVKGKSGFKVIRVKDFLRVDRPPLRRKEDDNRKRNLAIGAGVVLGAGGIALLLRKKGIKFPGNIVKENNLAKATEKVITPKDTVSAGEKFIKQMDEEFASVIKAPKIEKDIIPDPWKTSIETKINTSNEILLKPRSEEVKLLTPAKNVFPQPVRSNMKQKDKLVVSSKEKVISSVVNMRNTQRNYDSLPLDMKVTIQMEKLLRRPTKISNLGRPPESTGLKVILDEGNKTPLDKVISKAKRKVGDRLKRESEIATKKESLIKKN